MGQARNPDSVKAEKMYHKGAKISEIAKKLGIAPNTVSNWKKRYEWDVDPASRKDTNKNHKKSQKGVKKRGAPKGNKNALGHDVTNIIGNTFAMKHGAYSNPLLKYFREDEQALVEEMETNPEYVARHEIEILTIREKRIINAINMIESGGDYVTDKIVRTETLREFDNDDQKALCEEMIEESIAKGARLPGHGFEVQTITEHKHNSTGRLRQELTTVQRAKAKYVEILHNIEKWKIENGRNEELHPLRVEMLDAQIEQVDANTARMLGENIELEDTSAADELIYGGGKDEVETPKPED